MKTKKWQSLNKIYIKGKVRYIFFFKKRFDMIISFTPKNIIVDIDCDDFLNHSFKIGDNLSIVKEWVNKKNHNIYYEINRY